MAAHSVSALKKWSCQNKQLPTVQSIKHLHLYDFDNTLFKSPLPNPKLWTSNTVGMLMCEDNFANGGWWHDEHVLEATGEGLAKEERRAWEGWWNEQIVNLVRLSMQQKDALTILLTGRGQDNFATIIKRMVASKSLEFDMICLKPKVGPQGQRFQSTMNYKQGLLEELVYTFKDAEEIRIYEDRPKHVKGFKDFFSRLSHAVAIGQAPVKRKPINAEVIHVPDVTTYLDPVSETAEIQRMINSHNTALQQNDNLFKPYRLQIKKTVFFTGYLLSPEDSSNLLPLIPLACSIPETDLKILANNILICPRPATQTVLEKVGGIGAKQIWQITGVGVHNNAVVAARVQPLPPSATVYTENATAFIVLACRKNAKPGDAMHIQQWQPVSSDQQAVFETTVGEKVQLRVEKEVAGETEFDSLFAREKGSNFNNSKRGRQNDHGDDHRNHQDENRRNRYRGGNHNRGGGNGPQGGHRDRPYPPRGGRNGNRGGGGGGGAGQGGGGRGGGKGRGGYKSLDDMGNGPRGGFQNQPNYDDHGPGGGGYDSSYPPLGARAGGGFDDSLGQMY